MRMYRPHVSRPSRRCTTLVLLGFAFFMRGANTTAAAKLCGCRASISSPSPPWVASRLRDSGISCVRPPGRAPNAGVAIQLAVFCRPALLSTRCADRPQT
ncbi:hypothetical protein PsYK624_123160 [Phanerochaete sordida]|uniref:Secreted protein n=1 Tax=Phanerochaete sordida TaxID=48140 RepID=A0A9P3GHL7_9APHY|nr:hypothetical protein PsYK624_123160 [Phanerochaete sordida]